MKLLADPAALIRDHRRSLTVIAAGYLALFLAGILVTVIVPQLRPEGLGGLASGQGATGLGQVITDSYRSGNIALAAVVTLAVNLISASLLQTTVPTLIVPFLGVVITLIRGLSWGVLFSPVGAEDGTFLIHYVTLLIEGAAYVLVGFSAWVQGRMFLQPARYGFASRRAGYLGGLVATLRIYVWVIALLVVGAIYEAFTVILFIA